MTRHCLYLDATLDGRCAASVFRQKYPDARLHALAHGQPIPRGAFADGDEVLAVDIHVPDPFPGLRVVDPSADANDVYDNLADYGCRLHQGRMQPQTPAVVGAWRALYPRYTPPASVSFLGLYAAHDLRNGYTRPFVFGLRTLDTTPASPIWDRLADRDDEFVYDVIDRGEWIEALDVEDDRRLTPGQAHVVGFEGLRAVALNRSAVDFVNFQFVFRPEVHDLALAYHRRADGLWHVDLFPGPRAGHVWELARARGGDGGDKRAYFTCAELPFER